MQPLLVIAYCLVFLYVIRKNIFFRQTPVPVLYLQLFFLLKVVAGIGLGLIYTYYYTDPFTADTFKFFRDSGVLFDSLRNHPADFFRMFTGIGSDSPELRHYYTTMDAWLNTDVLFNDNKTIIRLNTLFRFFSLGNYYVHVVFINFISFIGLYCLYRTFLSYVPGRPLLLFVLTLCVPSIVFWGSGLLKDGFLLFALGMVLYAAKRIFSRQFRLRHILFLAGGLWLLVLTKFYVLLLVLPGLLAWYHSSKRNDRRIFIRFLVYYGIYFLAGFNLYHFFPSFSLVDILYWKQQNFYVIAGIQHAKSVISIPPLEPSVWGILKNTPMAFLNTLIRPFLTDIHGNPFILMAAVENLLILCLLVLAVILSFRNRKQADPFIYFSLMFVVLMFMLIGLITPILGAMVRYKVPALPFLFFLISYLLDSPRGKLISLSALKKKTGNTIEN